MATKVTMHVFSGRQNPSWTLNAKQAREFLARVHAAGAETMRKPRGAAGLLGYRGFTVESTPTTAAPGRATFVHEGVIDPGPGEASLLAGDREVETWLLRTCKAKVQADVLTHVREAIAAQPAPALLDLPPVGARCPKCMAQDAPLYNPGKWNVPTVQPFNNCYNYANDNPTNTFAQPGRGSGKMYSQLTCADVGAAAGRDGLVAVPNFSAPLAKGKGWYVALVIWPGTDYHWYRQDSVGCWSHKPGSTAVRNVDNAGNPISDPATCNRGPYVNFCTYMVTTTGARIR